MQEPVTSQRLKGDFFVDTVFNLNQEVTTESKIKFLGRGLRFVPTPKFSNAPAFRPKSQ